MAAHPRRFRGVRGSPKLPQASSDRTDRDPGGSRDGCNATIANRACFGGSQQAALTFVQMRGQQDETIADWSEVSGRALSPPWDWIPPHQHYLHVILVSVQSFVR